MNQRSASAPEYRGVYINLARSTDRDQLLRANLKEAGLDKIYSRYEAVDGSVVAYAHQTTLKAGELGSWLSVQGILESQQSAQYDLHILEDDLEFCRGFAKKFGAVQRQLDTIRDSWDIVYTDLLFPPDHDTYRHLFSMIKAYAARGDLSLLQLSNHVFAAISSVLINRQSIHKCLDFVRSGWNEGLPIDLYFKLLVRRGKLKAFVTVPFLTSTSDISVKSEIRGDLDRSRQVGELLRCACFVDADIPKLEQRLQDLVEGSTNTRLDFLYSQAVRFTLSDQYERY